MHYETANMIAAFCHIPKTGGMTFVHLLRQYFGIRHLETQPLRGWVYSRSDLKRDLRCMPWLRSITGHGLRPYADLGPASSRIQWYTILRDPTARSISNYQHQVEKQRLQMSFLEWLERPVNRNWHVRMLAGEEQDLEAAKKILTERVHCLGFMENYDEFLLILREKMNWQGFRVAYARQRNPAKAGIVRDRIYSQFDRYEEAIRDSNELDQALYDYARDVLYPRQIQTYGPQRLAADLKTEFADTASSVSERIRKISSTVSNKLVYGTVLAGLREVRWNDKR